MKYGQELPVEVEAQLDAYIERIKAIKWFQPCADLKKSDIDTQISLALKAFGVEASIEYRALKTPGDCGAARDAARDAAFGAACDAACDAACGAARGAAFDAAWGAAWGAADILALNLDGYKAKYPQGNFINLIPLYEAGLYPVGVVGGKFIVYVPASKKEFPSELIVE